MEHTITPKTEILKAFQITSEDSYEAAADFVRRNAGEGNTLSVGCYTYNGRYSMSYTHAPEESYLAVGWDIKIGDWIVFSPCGVGFVVTNDIMLQYYIINP